MKFYFFFIINFYLFLFFNITLHLYYIEIWKGKKIVTMNWKETSLNYNCDKVESKEAGLRRDEVENKDLRKR